MVFIDGTSRDVRPPEEEEEQEQEEKKVWRPPATAESSRTASLARTTRARSRNRNRFPGWTHPPTSNIYYIYRERKIFDMFNLNLGQKIGNMNEKWDHFLNPAQGLMLAIRGG